MDEYLLIMAPPYKVRCGLSFLSIQEPRISKYCSFCRTEALDEEYVAIARGRKLCKLASGLFETFDTCLYCAGKFQPLLAIRDKIPNEK